MAGPPSWPSLTLKLAALLHRLGAAPADDAGLRARVHTCVAPHFPAEPPAWLLAMLDAALAQRLTGARVRLPTGQADAELALSRALEPLARAFHLGVHDSGEALFWPMPALDQALLIDREGEPFYVLRPWSGPWRERGLDGTLAEGELRAGQPVGHWRHLRPDGSLLYTFDHGR